MKFCPNGDPPPPAVTKVYPHLTVAPRLLEYFVPGTGWKMAGPDVYATRDTIAWLRQYPKATSVGIAVGPHRVADFAVAELLPVKCLSLWQPWATLIALGAKRNETRSWSTAYRGPLAIHAAKTRTGVVWVEEAQDAGAREIRLILHDHDLDLVDLPLGAVVATAELVAVVPTTRAAVAAQELLLGDYTHGRWAWKLDEIVQLPEPLYARGRQGLFEIDL